MQTNPVKAIRDWCLQCSGDSYNNLKSCPSTDCPLYPFRLGKNPFRTPRKLSDEQRAACIANLASARKNVAGNQGINEMEGIEDD